MKSTAKFSSKLRAIKVKEDKQETDRCTNKRAISNHSIKRFVKAYLPNSEEDFLFRGIAKLMVRLKGFMDRNIL